jgi:Mg-chelatase subunit ChlD
MRARTTLLACSVLALVAAACAADPIEDGRFDRRPAGGTNDDVTGGGSLGGDGNGPTGGVDDVCATSRAEAAQLPLHMVVVLDKSGSMCEYTANQNPRDCNNPSSRWQQVTSALTSFFASAQSKGITVSLIAFPLSSGTCNASTYQTPLRDDIALPDTGGILAAEIGKLTGDGSTPTRPALEGAINYGKTLEAKLEGKGKVAIVMATDGYPQDCSNNSIGSASNVAAAVKDTMPTYVIGVGSRLANLDALADAGGTDKAFHVSTTNAASVAQEFSDALAQIRGAQLACEYELPEAPAGETLDLDKVNVQITAGKTETLAYSADCAAPGGWRYDDPAAPTRIELCESACQRVKSEGTAAVDLVLGCQTKGVN